MNTIKTLPAGTRIYLTKRRNNHVICIQPGSTILNDTMYVKYDVKCDGAIVIPRGTRIVGDWVTESAPTVAAQFQANQIYLHPAGQSIMADSDVIDSKCIYNSAEVSDAAVMYKINRYRSSSNVKRRIVKIGCRVKTLLDNNRKTTYLEISTVEIPIILSSDFVKFPDMIHEITNPITHKAYGGYATHSINQCLPNMCGSGGLGGPCGTSGLGGPCGASGLGGLGNPCNPCDPCAISGPCGMDLCCPPQVCPPPTPPLGAIDPFLNRGNFSQPRFTQRPTIYNNPVTVTVVADPPVQQCPPPCPPPCMPCIQPCMPPCLPYQPPCMMPFRC